jgi:hypothetical protein
MTKVKYFPATWLKYKLVMVAVVQRGSPLEEKFGCLHVSKQPSSISQALQVLG